MERFGSMSETYDSANYLNTCLLLTIFHFMFHPQLKRISLHFVLEYRHTINYLLLEYNLQAVLYLPTLYFIGAPDKHFFRAVKLSLHVQFVCPISKPLTRWIFDNR